MRSALPYSHSPRSYSRRSRRTFRVTANAGNGLLAGVCALGLVMAIAVAAAPAGGAAKQLQPLASSEQRAGAVIGVHATDAERGHGFITVRGEATNISNKPLAATEAIVEFFDAQGRLKSVETAALKMTALSAGDESPFIVQAADADEISSYRIRFRKMLGAPLPSCLIP